LVMKKKSIFHALFLLALGAGLIAAAMFWSEPVTPPAAPTPMVAETPAPVAPTSSTNAKPEVEAPVTEPQFHPVVEPVGNVLGSPDAPVKIDEFSSLTCGHCAHFHNTVLPEFRVKYIDTGLVQLTFHEFPLNKPAMDATKLLQCLPDPQYFGFLSLLFQTQEHWAFTPDYLDRLKQSAKLAGLDDEKIDACLNNADTDSKISADIAEASKKYDITSTPTFIINGGVDKAIGAIPVSEFAKKIDPLLPPSTTKAAP
jgi:protein-disulfide isomerase